MFIGFQVSDWLSSLQALRPRQSLALPSLSPFIYPHYALLLESFALARLYSFVWRGVALDSFAVQIGAGNIGRGFLAQLYHESGLSVRFVDANPELVDRLNAAGAYAVEIAAAPPVPPVHIDRFHALHVSDADAIADVLKDAAIVSVSVGANALLPVSRMLAELLVPRLRDVRAPLNILVCENPPGQAATFRDLVRDRIDPDLRDAFDTRIGFVDTVIGRMVPVMEDAASLNVRVEPYCELPVDADAVVGELPHIDNLHAESPFAFWIDRKLYMHNAAHAAAAYMGYLNGHEFVYEAVEDAAVHSRVAAVLQETGEALHRQYGQDLESLTAHADDLLDRFANRALRDTVERVARDPVRKLGANERFMRAAACCLAQGVEPHGLAFAAAAAIRYDHPSDPTAATVQALLRDEGWDAVLERVCGLPPGSPFARLIKESGLSTATKDTSKS